MIDIAEKKFWNEPNYLETAPTLFDYLRKYQVESEIVGLAHGSASAADIVEHHQFEDLKPWTYLFIGDVDGLSHNHTQESPYVISKLKRFDHILEQVVSKLRAKSRELWILAFSDHGHLHVTKKIDPYEHFRQRGDNLNRYFHIIDANFLRMWFKNSEQENQARNVLSRLEGGWILDNDELQKNHVLMPDNRFGELVYYLDTPAVFSKTIWGWSRSIQSMHGYLPDHDGMDGFIASSHPFDTTRPCQLVDILPSTMRALGLPVPENLDGKEIWT